MRYFVLKSTTSTACLIGKNRIRRKESQMSLPKRLIDIQAGCIASSIQTNSKMKQTTKIHKMLRRTRGRNKWKRNLSHFLVRRRIRRSKRTRSVSSKGRKGC